MSVTSFEKESEKAVISIEGDVSVETLPLKDATETKVQTNVKKPRHVGPPRPSDRDGMGRYKIPVGGKPLTVNDIPDPAPNSYWPQYTRVMKTYPGWSFGEKDSDKAKTITPAPNKYNTSGDLKWGKCKTITIKKRIEQSFKRTRKWPGPTTYSIERSVTSGPKYTMRIKPKSNFAPGLVSALALQPDPETPGPNYNISPEEWLLKPQSFGIRHKETKKYIGPGPQKYFYTEKPAGPKWIIGESKGSFRKAPPTPGPERYSLKSTIGDAPKFSIGGCFHPQHSKFITPGPDVYNSAGIRLDEPGFTMKYRWFEQRPEKRPGPYFYSDEQIRRKMPAYTMSIKGKLSYPSSVYSNFREDGPAPNQYNVPRDQLQQGRSFSMKLKDTDHLEAPGPADYQNTDHLNVNQLRAPAYSLGKKMTKTLESGPGPGAYDVKYQDSTPGKTFGVKPEKKEHEKVTESTLYPVDISKVCGTCDYIPGPTLKSRHTPHKYLGIKDSSLIPPTPTNERTNPLIS